MTQDAPSDPKAVIRTVVAAMHSSHEALARFDGAAFAYSVQQEVEIAENLVVAMASRMYVSTPQEFAELLRYCRMRRAWLASMRRTVAALSAVCATARETYHSAAFEGR